MTTTPEPAARNMRVFISYSRVDSAFAEQLRVALIDRGYEANLDRQDIAPGEPWEARLEALITDADAVVYVMSPESLRSVHCKWEVKRSLELKKTLTPLMWRPADDIDAPEGLAALNYVFFDVYERSQMTDVAAFEASLAKLQEALAVADVFWVREHTKWLGRAMEWHRVGRPEGKLLPSDDVAAVQSWANDRPANKAIPHEILDYIAASLSYQERIRHEKISREQKIDQQTQLAVAALAQQAREAQRFDAALRLALAGESGDVPEPARRAHIAASAHASACVARMAGHTKSLSSAAFSADGARIVTASQDNSARIWNAETGAALALLPHDDWVTAAAFSPDARLVATSCIDKAARIWSADGALLFTLSGHSDMVKGIAFDPTGALLLTASADHTSRTWDVATGRERACLKGHEGAVVHAIFSPDGRKVLTCSDDGSARIWSVKGKLLRRLLGHTGRVWTAAFSADGASVVTASADHTARVWDVASGKERVVLRGHTSPVSSVALSPGNDRVVTGSKDRTARVWDAATGRELAHFAAHTGWVECVEFLDDARVVSASSDMTARVWDASSGTELLRLAGHDNQLSTLALSADGARIVTTSDDHSARIWDPATGTELAILGERKGSEWHGPAFSDDGARFCAGSHDGKARIWSVADFSELRVLDVGGGIVWDTLFNPAGDHLVTASADGLVRIWDTKSGKEVRRFTGHEGAVYATAFSPDGARLVSASADKRALIWEVESGSCLARLEGHEKAVSRASFSADGDRILTSSGDGSARIWDAATGAQVLSFSGHDDWVSTAAFSPAGDRVVTASNDLTVRIWDAHTGGELARFTDASPFTSASFSSNGERIMATLAGGAMRVWDVASEIEIARHERYQAPMSDVIHSPDGTLMVTTSDDGLIRFWDATWLTGLTGASLVQAVANERLKGMASLSDDELALLRPVLGDVDRDIASRLVSGDNQSSDLIDAWRRHRRLAREMAALIWGRRTQHASRAPVSTRRDIDKSRDRAASSLLTRIALIALLGALVAGGIALVQAYH
ncbi:MAG: hypothetical protein DCF16_08410 [Alphaproteobacteria bacterium]|nr:MAG: hypothetical protein DCF16_08410 [Alphaproteobacteria bacterium]